MIEHHVAAVLNHAHVDVKTRAGLAHSDFRREGDVEAHLVGQVANHPLGNGELVGSVLRAHGQELDLVLLVDEAILGEVAHLAVAVLDLAAGLGDVLHAALAELAGLGIGCRLVVSALVDGGEHVLGGENHIILQFAHGMELHAGNLGEGVASLGERVLRRTLQVLAVLVEVGAEQAQRWQLGEWVDESRAVARQHVQVATASLDKVEQAGAVDALAAGEDGLKVVQVVDDEVQRLEFAVAARIHEVDHLDIVLGDIAHQVGALNF